MAGNYFHEYNVSHRVLICCRPIFAREPLPSDREGLQSTDFVNLKLVFSPDDVRVNVGWLHSHYSVTRVLTQIVSNAVRS